MKRKQLKRNDILQLCISIVAIILASYLLSFAYARIDLTSEKRYTLSNSTKEILETLDDVVFVKVYLEGDLNISFKRMRNSIKELLEEFRVIAKDHIEYEFINPSRHSDSKVRNAIYNDLYNKGLNPTNIHDKDAEGKVTQKLIFPGIILSQGEKQIAVNLLLNNTLRSAEENLNNSIQLIEYKLIDGMNKLIAPKDKTIAFVEGHGELDEYETGDITEELSSYYNIHRIIIDGKIELLKDYSTLIIAKPTERFPEEDKLALDQYIMSGGKVLWLVDPVQVSMDSLTRSSSTLAYIKDLNLDDILFKYGVRINPELIQDMNCALIPVNVATSGNKPQFAPAPWLYYPLIDPSNNHSLTKNVNYIRSEFASTIDTVGIDMDVDKTILLQSSDYTRKLKVPAIISLSQISSNPDPSFFNVPNQVIAVLLEGRFESVFTNRIVEGIKKGEFIEQSKPTKMIVIADGDMIKNRISRKPDGVMISPLGYDRYTKQTYGNKEFIMNAINYLNDERGLMDMRSKHIQLRLLNKTKIQKERLKWQMINIVLPVAFIILFGLFALYIRKRRYSS